jgi:hypothetical protein
MGVTGYVHKKVPPKDNRTPEGGYYQAICDECGRQFYPLRSNAKFCSDHCSGRHHHRRYRAEGRYKYAKGGKVSKEEPKVENKPIKRNLSSSILRLRNKNNRFRGAEAVYDFLESKGAVKREKGKLMEYIKNADIGEILEIRGWDITKKSSTIYVVEEGK